MVLSDCDGFEWDEGNLLKNWIKHAVSNLECEECFFNYPFVVFNDDQHSQDEKRYFALGQSNQDRYLFLVFTVRGRYVRIISGRSMSYRERRIYDEKKEDPFF